MDVKELFDFWDQLLAHDMLSVERVVAKCPDPNTILAAEVAAAEDVEHYDSRPMDREERENRNALAEQRDVLHEAWKIATDKQLGI